jgi:hypothetical protein
MAARVGIGHLLDDFLEVGMFAEFLWMDGCGSRRQ